MSSAFVSEKDTFTTKNNQTDELFSQQTNNVEITNKEKENTAEAKKKKKIKIQELTLINTRTGILFKHGGVQTTKRQPSIYKPPHLKRSRDTQTAICTSAKQQTSHDTSTQMTGPGVDIWHGYSKVIQAKKYIPAEEVLRYQLQQVIKLQSYWRRWLAVERVKSLKKGSKKMAEWRDAEIHRRMEVKEMVKKIENRRLTRPSTLQDVQLLRDAVHKWKLSEVSKIHAENQQEKSKKMSKIVEEEARLLGLCDVITDKIRKSQTKKEVESFFEKTSEPKIWEGKRSQKTLNMSTPGHIRAAMLKQMYETISSPMHQNDERLDALLSLKNIIKDYDLQLTRELTSLVERETELIVRGMARLDGLRQRICTLFLEFCKSPSCNPHAAFVTISAKQKTQTKRQPKNEDKEETGDDNDEYEKKRCRIVEEELRNGFDEPVVLMMQSTDLKYLTESIWESRSVLSGEESGNEGKIDGEEDEELELVKWQNGLPWSPWNCVLMTKNEAHMHQKVQDIHMMYSADVLQNVSNKHTLAFSHFSNFLHLIYNFK